MKQLKVDYPTTYEHIWRICCVSSGSRQVQCHQYWPGLEHAMWDIIPCDYNHGELGKTPLSRDEIVNVLMQNQNPFVPNALINVILAQVTTLDIASHKTGLIETSKQNSQQQIVADTKPDARTKLLTFADMLNAVARLTSPIRWWLIQRCYWQYREPEVNLHVVLQHGLASIPTAYSMMMAACGNVPWLVLQRE